MARCCRPGICRILSCKTRCCVCVFCVRPSTGNRTGSTTKRRRHWPILQVGVDGFRTLLMSSPEIEVSNAGLLKVEARARVASKIAQIWSSGRGDLNPEEVAVAALLAGTGDLLLWVYDIVVVVEERNAATNRLHNVVFLLQPSIHHYPGQACLCRNISKACEKRQSAGLAAWQRLHIARRDSLGHRHGGGCSTHPQEVTARGLAHINEADLRRRRIPSESACLLSYYAVLWSSRIPDWPFAFRPVVRKGGPGDSAHRAAWGRASLLLETC